MKIEVPDIPAGATLRGVSSSKLNKWRVFLNAIEQYTKARDSGDEEAMKEWGPKVLKGKKFNNEIYVARGHGYERYIDPNIKKKTSALSRLVKRGRGRGKKKRFQCTIEFI